VRLWRIDHLIHRPGTFDAELASDAAPVARQFEPDNPKINNQRPDSIGLAHFPMKKTAGLRVGRFHW